MFPGVVDFAAESNLANGDLHVRIHCQLPWIRRTGQDKKRRFNERHRLSSETISVFFDRMKAMSRQCRMQCF